MHFDGIALGGSLRAVFDDVGFLDLELARCGEGEERQWDDGENGLEAHRGGPADGTRDFSVRAKWYGEYYFGGRSNWLSNVFFLFVRMGFGGWLIGHVARGTKMHEALVLCLGSLPWSATPSITNISRSTLYFVD